MLMPVVCQQLERDETCRQWDSGRDGFVDGSLGKEGFLAVNVFSTLKKKDFILMSVKEETKK